MYVIKKIYFFVTYIYIINLNIYFEFNQNNEIIVVVL